LRGTQCAPLTREVQILLDRIRKALIEPSPDKLGQKKSDTEKNNRYQSDW